MSLQPSRSGTGIHFEPDEQPSYPVAISLRLLRHLATTVRHQKYHDTDILTLQVDPPAA